ncbi:MAG: AMP-dependent synthetase/ligase [Saprospiraceae bacterium]
MNEKRLFDYLYDQAESFPQERAFGHKKDGEWRYWSTLQMTEKVNEISLGLLQLGVQPGDKIASVVYRTSPEWVALDFALLQIGALHVPMYPTISAREYRYILDEAEVRYCFTGDGDLYEKVSAAAAQLSGLREILSLSGGQGIRAWDDLPQGGDTERLARIRDSIKPDDICTLIYTSGTTGNPKGVMLSHRNIVFNVEAMRNLIPMTPGMRALSFLPVSHIFERAVIYAYTAYGASVAFTGTENLGGDNGDLKSVSPHFFTTVPRLLEKVYDKILDKGLQLKGLKRALFFWAMRLTDDWAFDKTFGGWAGLQRRIADRLIFAKWREALGGSIRGIITGANACPANIMRTFNAAGIQVREGYGLTEAAPAIAFSRFEKGGALLGAVGLPLEGVSVRIEPLGEAYGHDEGEVWASGPGIMHGYYKKPEETAEVIRQDESGVRWLVTGDVGRWVKGPSGARFLKITDRKRELIKTSGGKFVAPAPIESMFKGHRLVEHAMVVGENLKFVSALIVPAADALREWCERHEITWKGISEMVRHPKVIERYQMLVERINPNFGHVEQVKKFALLDMPWEPVKTDGTEAELTPTLKLKRRVILQKYQSVIAELYR